MRARIASKVLLRSLNRACLPAIANRKHLATSQGEISRIRGNIAHLSTVAAPSTNHDLHIGINDPTGYLDLNTDPLFVHVYPGSRVCELATPYNPAASGGSGNVLSPSLVTMLQSKLESFQKNRSISAILFSSRSPDLFSVGLVGESHSNSSTGQQQAKGKGEEKTAKSNDEIRFLAEDDEDSPISALTTEHLTACNKLAATISRFTNSKKDHRKATIAVFGGKVAGSAYGVFGSCKYRLGTRATEFSIPEIAQGFMPVGGLAYHLAKGCDEGAAVARYLAITGHTLRADEMCAIGLLSHVVEEEPHVSLLDALAHTLPDEEARGINEVVAGEAIEELLDSMHISCDLDISRDKLFDEMLLVPFSQVPLEVQGAAAAAAAATTTSTKGTAKDAKVQSLPEILDQIDFVNMLPVIGHCFSVDDVAAVKKRLLALETPFGNAVAAQLTTLLKEKTTASSVENWFKLTKLAKTESFENVCRMELTANTILLKRK